MAGLSRLDNPHPCLERSFWTAQKEEIYEIHNIEICKVLSVIKLNCLANSWNIFTSSLWFNVPNNKVFIRKNIELQNVALGTDVCTSSPLYLDSESYMLIVNSVLSAFKSIIEMYTLTWHDDKTGATTTWRRNKKEQQQQIVLAYSFEFRVPASKTWETTHCARLFFGLFLPHKPNVAEWWGSHLIRHNVNILEYFIK